MELPDLYLQMGVAKVSGSRMLSTWHLLELDRIGDGMGEKMAVSMRPSGSQRELQQYANR